MMARSYPTVVASQWGTLHSAGYICEMMIKMSFISTTFVMLHTVFDTFYVLMQNVTMQMVLTE
jgi:hypothetical protein